MSYSSSVAPETFKQSESRKDGIDAVPVAEAVAAELQPIYLSRAPSQPIVVTLAERSYGLENNMVHPTYCPIVFFGPDLVRLNSYFHFMSFHISLSLSTISLNLRSFNRSDYLRCMSRMLRYCLEFIILTSQDTGGMAIVKRKTKIARVLGRRIKAF